MYNPNDCSFTNSIMDYLGDSNIYHFDDTYYIRYYSKKALFALEKIYEDINLSNLEEASFYYHIYVDLLFDAVGLINDRFVFKNRNYSEELEKNINRNIIEYDFTSDNYPLLSDKGFRNFIEHINERSELLIKNKKYYGTFNFVHESMKKELCEELLSEDKPQNNILNLINKTYNIIDENEGVLIKKSISLEELKKELIIINKHSNNIWNYINNMII